MIGPELLEILRCPMDPSHTRLALEGEKLVCQRCRLQFHIKDGLADLRVEGAELPPGCDSLSQLPCQFYDPNTRRRKQSETESFEEDDKGQ